MSWKSFVTAGLLCVLATPAFAQPTMDVNKAGTVSNGHLDTLGRWVWEVEITPDYGLVPDASGTPVAAELGLTSTAGNGESAVINAAVIGAGFDTPNPGNVIFGWEPLTPLGGTGDCSSGDPGDCPVGILVGTGGATNQVFASIGSANKTAGAQKFLTVTGGRPVVSLADPNTTSVITVEGAYGAGSVLGRIAQIDGGTVGPPPTYTTANFDTFAGTFTRNARGGDADLDGDVDFTDFQSNLLLNFNQSGKSWQHGDFDGTGTVDFNDFQILLTQFNTTYSVGGAPGSGGGGTAVPEPTAAILMLLAGSFLGFRRMRG